MRESVQPRQVILVTARGNANVLGRDVHKDNIITIAWHMPLSFNPEMYGVCVGKTRFSYKLIHESKVFAVNFISHELKEDALFCGRASGETTDKFEKTSLTKQECESIDCCKIAEASAVLECELVEEIETGDHVIFVGKVLNQDKRDDRKRLFHLGGDEFTSTLK